MTMFRLAHISDVHLGPLPPFKRRQLANKRLTGYLNWKLNRKSTLKDGVLDKLIAHLKAADPDHIAVTGDLVNLALPEEIALMSGWLEALGAPDHVSIVPGNHDTYVPGALAEITRAWRPYMTGDEDGGGFPFPYRRDRGDVALIGVNTGQASMPFMATGTFNQRQANQMEVLLNEAHEDGKFRVVMIHHPPFKNATAWSKRLIGAGLFRSVIARCGAELVLHGHTHIDSFESIDGPNGKVAVLGVPSASKSGASAAIELNKKNPKPGARYNLIEITGKTGAWNCSMKEFGYSAGATNVTLLGTRNIIENGKSNSEI